VGEGEGRGYTTYREFTDNFGYSGELAVVEELRRRGYTVRHDGGNAPHDLVIDGSTTVEVKTACPTAGSNGNKRRWQFKLYQQDGHHRPLEEDILILVLQEHSGLTKIDITSAPDRYGGRYALFLEAWDLLALIVAANAQRGVQAPLFQEEPLPF